MLLLFYSSITLIDKDTLSFVQQGVTFFKTRGLPWKRLITKVKLLIYKGYHTFMYVY